MNTGKRDVWLAALAMALCWMPAGAARADEPQAAERRIQVTVNAEEDADDPGQLQLALDIEEVKPGTYWIGVVCSPLDDELLKSHLDLQHGLVVTQVVADSPAQKAGLQKDDILIQVGEQPLTNLRVLVASTEKAQDNELTLTLVRKGKQLQVQVTPDKRPAQYVLQQMRPDVEAAAEWKMLQEVLRQHGAAPKAGDEDSDRTSMMLVMPGFVLPDQAKELPKDLEVTITKKGQQEAKITVKQGDKQWDVDAKSLDKLPEDIRPHIEKMLGREREMHIRMGTDGIGLFGTSPRDLFAPRIIRKSLQLAPDKVYELHRLAPELNKELRAKIHNQLQEAHQTLEAARTRIPADALEKIEQELKTLREQLEQLRNEEEKE